MNRYNYEEAVKTDIAEWLTENGERYATENGTIDENGREKIYDALWVADSVTGNASGSYTFSTWQAEENLCHNTDLMEECAEEFYIDLTDGKTRGAEYWDVSIRCMLLGRVLDECIAEYNEAHETDEEEGAE